MRVLKSGLKKIIQEELQTVLNEGCLPGHTQIGNRRDGNPICSPTTSVPEKGASEVRPHANWPAGRASEVEFRARDRRRRRPIDDESWLARKIINFFNFEKWYPDLLGFGSTKGEAAICDPNNENCYPVESPTPNVPGRLYGKTDPDIGVQLPGRVGGGRIQEHKLNQIIQEEYIKLLSEADQLPPGVLTTEPINIKLYGHNPNLRPGAPALAQDVHATKYRKTMSQLHPNLSAEQLDAMVIRDRELRKALKITGPDWLPWAAAPEEPRLPLLGGHQSHGGDPDKAAEAALAAEDDLDIDQPDIEPEPVPAVEEDIEYDRNQNAYDFKLDTEVIIDKTNTMRSRWVLPKHVHPLVDQKGNVWGLYNEVSGYTYGMPERRLTNYAREQIVKDGVAYKF